MTRCLVTRSECPLFARRNRPPEQADAIFFNDVPEDVAMAAAQKLTPQVEGAGAVFEGGGIERGLVWAGPPRSRLDLDRRDR